MELHNLSIIDKKEAVSINGGFLGPVVCWIIYETLDDLEGSFEAFKEGAEAFSKK